MSDPIQVLREWVTVTERKYGRVRLTRTVTAEQAVEAFAQVEALVEAARRYADWGMEVGFYSADCPCPSCRMTDALAPFKENP